MEKVIVLAILVAINAQLVVSTCDNDAFHACHNNLRKCATGGSHDVRCSCLGSDLKCSLKSGCINSTQYQELVGFCMTDCSAHQCSSGLDTVSNTLSKSDASVALSGRPVATSSEYQCNAQSAGNCANDFNSCVLSAGTNINAICSCYGPYFQCLSNINCLTSSNYQTIEVSSSTTTSNPLTFNQRTCESSGCSSQQCSWSAYSPVSTCNQCNTQSATNCANNYNSCVLSAGTNINAICSCYGPYFECLWNINCLTSSEYQTIIQTCATSGCTAQQCGANFTSNTPAQAPFDTPTSSAPPTNAPSVSPPDSAISLQPWELALVIVGSLLSGIGIASIAVFFSRCISRRTSAKSNPNYSVLQQY